MYGGGQILLDDEKFFPSSLCPFHMHINFNFLKGNLSAISEKIDGQ
jgi:hypothetical protein